MRARKIPAEPVYIMMNKASGTVCSTVSDRRKTVYETLPQELLVSPEGAKLHTVGRLDADTTGLLLLTNDGLFSNYLTRPESHIQKVYEVTLRDIVLEEQQKEYSKKALGGILMPPEKKAPQQYSGFAVIQWPVENIQTGSKICRIVLTEGKFHEVKRIFRALGNEVVELKRIEMEGIRLDESLEPGQWKLLDVDFLSKSLPAFSFKKDSC